MKRKKLLARISDWLDMDGKKHRDRREELEELLEKLGKKEASLKEKLKREKNKRKRKQLSTELDIARVQRVKGVKILEGLGKQ